MILGKWHAGPQGKARSGRLPALLHPVINTSESKTYLVVYQLAGCGH